MTQTFMPGNAYAELRRARIKIPIPDVTVRCGECGMPLEDVAELHPIEACRLYVRTRDAAMVRLRFTEERHKS